MGLPRPCHVLRLLDLPDLSPRDQLSRFARIWLDTHEFVNIEAQQDVVDFVGGGFHLALPGDLHPRFEPQCVQALGHLIRVGSSLCGPDLVYYVCRVLQDDEASFHEVFGHPYERQFGDGTDEDCHVPERQS